MKGDERVIELLNEALRNELTATNQYWLHYRMLDNWGVRRLAAFERGESIDEMKHADRLAERILFLDGLPNFQLMGRLRIGETVEEVLRADLELELEALEQLRGGEIPRDRRIVLLDLNMPQMNGIEFLRELRADAELKLTPVIVLTTSNDERDRIEAYNLNVAGYLLKPMTFSNFCETMAALNKYWALVELP